jgi:type II secretory pathway predicted ATPase ExeA
MKLEDTGLRRQPFQTHGKPLILVPNTSQKAAIRFLNEIRFNDHGLGLFHGPPLSGKTSIIRRFAALLPNDYAVAIVDGAGMGATALLQEILSQFGYDLGLDSENERFNMVSVFAMQQTASDQAPLLIIENAHAMGPVLLEMLCELAELTINGKSALRIILASDRAMLPIVRAPAMRSISQRVTGKYLLQPLTRKETANYVYRKLLSSGCKNPQAVVPPAVCDRLHTAACGWPGMVDRLALMAFSKAERFPLRVDHIPQRPAAKRKTAKTIDSVPHLILTCRRKTLKRMELNKPRLLIGRNELCDLHFTSNDISRQHALLARNGSATIIVDLKSKHGTSVNGKRVTKQVLINNDIISVGNYRIKFMDPSARRRTTLQGAGWDDTTIAKSITDFRNVLAKQLKSKCAS